MVKQRFTTLDVYAMTREIKRALFPSNMCPYRVQNIYQLSQKTFILKLTRSDSLTLDESIHPLKYFLLIESGIRLHPTIYDLLSNVTTGYHAASPLLLKMRQYIKGKRIVSLDQIANDRVVSFVFGMGEEYEFRMYLELYSSGNIIITNSDNKIISLLRVVENDKLTVKTNLVYSSPSTKDPFLCDEATLSNILSRTENLKKLTSLHPIFQGSTILAQMASTLYSQNPTDAKLVINSISSLLLNLSPAGYIIKSEAGNIMEYTPIINFSNEHILEFPSFGAAADYFYFNLESQVALEKEIFLKCTAEQKKISIKETLEARVTELSKLESFSLDKARAIEENEDIVSSVLWVIQSALATGMSWEDILILIKKEQGRDNRVANIINGVDFSRNLVEITLSSVILTIDLSLNPRGNAQRWYNERRAAIMKREKAMDIQASAMASASRKIDAELKTALSKIPGVVYSKPIRKILWFEKFSWFISSDNILVVAGTNAQQNEKLVKKYLGSKDIYLHAELQGAPSVIIKCHLTVDSHSDWLPPPSTLSQAASMAVCLSSAWTCNIVTGAYWVYSHQVSKTPPTGLHLPPGSFMIYGKKNFVAPSPLVYGFGFLFKLGDSESIERHRPISQDETNQLEYQQNSIESFLDPEFLKKEEERLRDISMHIQPPLVKNESKILQKKELKKLQKSNLQELSNVKQSRKNAQKEKKNSKNQHLKPQKIESEKTVPLHQVRGTYGKLKKIKKKYQHQDIEDTITHLELLGVQDPQTHVQRLPNLNSKVNFVEKQKECLASAIQCPDKTMKHSDMSEQYVNAKKEHLFSTEDEYLQLSSNASNLDNFPSSAIESLNDINAVGNNTDDVTRGDALLFNHDSDDDFDPANEIEISSLLETFTGHPFPEDIMEHCIPMCGPWSAFQNFLCRVKLTPGTLKKGKAIKMATSLCLMQLSNEDNKEFGRNIYSLIKSVKEDAMINTIIQNCKIAGPSQAIQKIQKSQKKTIKLKAKEKAQKK